MDIIFYLYGERLDLFLAGLGIIFVALGLVLIVVSYIYVSVNLKGICEIFFKDEKKYTIPLEPFNFFFMSMLPTTFWREILNIKYNKSFKNLYSKEFYYPIDKSQLIELLNKYPLFFKIQYMIFCSGGFALFFIIFSFIFDKYFM
ncbi:MULTISPECIES: hypothetical protein [Acinetobacter]|uniref:hypothetical protein n=1 Tax=Acinetobacter TaxID=469 RepID=UPI00192C18A2|nr:MULTISPECIES: hypothetical protein [Acinetobacter]MEB3862508.1 hypothetical protein [Acinetobacter sp. IK31]